MALGKKNVRASCLPKGQAEVFFGALNQDTTTSVCVGYAHAFALCLKTSLNCYLCPVSLPKYINWFDFRQITEQHTRFIVRVPLLITKIEKANKPVKKFMIVLIWLFCAGDGEVFQIYCCQVFWEVAQQPSASSRAGGLEDRNRLLWNRRRLWKSGIEVKILFWFYRKQCFQPKPGVIWGLRTKWWKGRKGHATLHFIQ